MTDIEHAIEAMRQRYTYDNDIAAVERLVKAAKALVSTMDHRGFGIIDEVRALRRALEADDHSDPEEAPS